MRHHLAAVPPLPDRVGQDEDRVAAGRVDQLGGGMRDGGRGRRAPGKRHETRVGLITVDHPRTDVTEGTVTFEQRMQLRRGLLPDHHGSAGVDDQVDVKPPFGSRLPYRQYESGVAERGRGGLFIEHHDVSPGCAPLQRAKRPGDLQRVRERCYRGNAYRCRREAGRGMPRWQRMKLDIMIRRRRHAGCVSAARRRFRLGMSRCFTRSGLRHDARRCRCRSWRTQETRHPQDVRDLLGQQAILDPIGDEPGDVAEQVVRHASSAFVQRPQQVLLDQRAPAAIVP